MKSKKQIFCMTGTILLLIAIAAVMMVIGRGHTVYFDNKALDYDGQTYETPYKVEINVNGERVAKLRDGERGMATWIGQNFKMEMVITQVKKGEEVTESYSVKLPYNMDGVIINIPGLLAGLSSDAYISEFISTTPEEPVEEEVVTDEFGITEKEEEQSSEEVPTE